MPTTVNIHEAKTHLSRLLARVLEGEEIVIARAGTPVARLLPYRQEARVAGRLEGQIRIREDFDDPLPEALRRAFGMEDTES